jgi:uncharacterized protein YdaT
MSSTIFGEKHKMTWKPDNYPTEFDKFKPEVRNIMIEIANRLMAEEGYEEVAAVSSAITLGIEQAEERGITIEAEEERRDHNL